MGSLLGLLSLLNTVLTIGFVQVSNSEECPFSCFLSGDQELLCSLYPNNTLEVAVACRKDLMNDRFIIGNRSSIRRIMPEGLKDISKFDSEGTLNIFLNTNILELTTTSFTGLEGVLSSLEFLHVGTIHPDTLMKHGKIASLNFDSDRVPQLPDYIRLGADVPAFLRLQPQDPSTPIEVNMDVRCHKCVGEKPFPKSTILTFSLHDSTKAADTLDTLTIVYMDTCPTLSNALGCPKNGSIDDYIVHVNASSGWEAPVDESEENFATVASGSTKTRPLLLSVIIWCTVLTLLLICLIIAMVIRRRIRAKRRAGERRDASPRRYSATSLKHIICGTASCEDLRRVSLSNGGTWVYGTPSQNSCSNLLSETRSQYSFRPPFTNMCYPHIRESMYSTELPSGYRASIPDILTLVPRSKPFMGNGDVLLMNGDHALPALPPNTEFRMSATPSYKRSHDGTFKMVQ